MINDALRRFIESQNGDMEKIVRRVLREELEPYVTRAKTPRRRARSKAT